MLKSNATAKLDEEVDTELEDEEDTPTPRISYAYALVNDPSQIQTVRPPSLLGRIPAERADAETMPPPAPYTLPNEIQDEVSVDLSDDPRADSD